MIISFLFDSRVGTVHHAMPDSFFATKTRKRKRVPLKDSGPSSSRKVLKASNGHVSAREKKRKPRATDEELHSDGGGSEALDDMDLRADQVDPNESGDEDAGETPAEKRLRLAKLYLESVREGIGASVASLAVSDPMFSLRVSLHN
jgi:ribosomal RNA-processing protein 9